MDRQILCGRLCVFGILGWWLSEHFLVAKNTGEAGYENKRIRNDDSDQKSGVCKMTSIECV
jgi:hypothetical protein